MLLTFLPILSLLHLLKITQCATLPTYSDIPNDIMITGTKVLLTDATPKTVGQLAYTVSYGSTMTNPGLIIGTQSVYIV